VVVAGAGLLALVAVRGQRSQANVPAIVATEAAAPVAP